MISEAHTREMRTNLVLMGKDLHFADTHDSFQSDDDFLLYETTGNLYGVWVDISALHHSDPQDRPHFEQTTEANQKLTARSLVPALGPSRSKKPAADSERSAPSGGGGGPTRGSGPGSSTSPMTLMAMMPTLRVSAEGAEWANA